MKSTSPSLSFESKSETDQANTNSDTKPSNLGIKQKVDILAECIKFERDRLGRELRIYRLLREVYKDEDDPYSEDDEEECEGEEDLESEEDEDDGDIPDWEMTDKGDLDWDEDLDENGLPYWVPDEVWNPEDELDADEETEPVDTRIVPIGWKTDPNNYNDPR